MLAGTMAAPLFAQPPGLYRIDTQASRIEIRVFRGGFLGGLGDNHQIALSRFSGTAEGSDGMHWEVAVQGESGSLEVKDPGVSDSTRQKVQATMLGATQLDVARYPVIDLRSRSMVPGDTGQRWRLLADLTLHDVTRQVEFPLDWTQDGDRIRVQGKKELRLLDFNIRPIRKALGSIQVRNEFELVYDITLTRDGRGRSE
jgi:polyisoprenoid-binding protein YceI